MQIKQYLRSEILTAGLALIGASCVAFGQETPADLRRMRQASEAEQVAWINLHLRAGMPPSEVFGDLILNRSTITLPVIEQKIEEVLRSPSPTEVFIDKSVNPQRFVDLAAEAITEAGDVQSLKESSKLIKVDANRFGWMVERTMIHSLSYRNPFTLAYRGLELGDSALDPRIATWIQARLRERRSTVPEAADAEMREVRGLLAEALVEKYGGVPTESQWAVDSIVSRLEPVRALILHDDVMRAASDAFQRRNKR